MHLQRQIVAVAAAVLIHQADNTILFSPNKGLIGEKVNNQRTIEF